MPATTVGRGHGPLLQNTAQKSRIWVVVGRAEGTASTASEFALQLLPPRVFPRCDRPCSRRCRGNQSLSHRPDLTRRSANRCHWRTRHSDRRSRVCAALGQLEHAHHLRQIRRLILHTVRRRSGLFDQCRILLRQRIDLDYGLIDLLDTRTLLVAGRRDVTHDVGDVPHAIDKLAHGCASLVNQRHAGVDPIN